MASDPRERFQQILVQLSALVRSDPRAALVQINRVMNQVGPEPNLLHLAGLAHGRAGDSSLAIELMQQSLELHPPQPELHNNLGKAMESLQRVEEAEHHYRQAINLQENFTQAQHNLGLLLLSQQRFDEAEVQLLQALAGAPGKVSLLTTLGNLYRAQEHFEQAIEYYQRALNEDGQYVNAIHNLGLCYKLTERPQKAIEYYVQAQRQAPNVAEIDLNYGNAEFELGHYQEAERCYLSAIAKDPSFVLAHESLSELLWQLDQKDRLTDSYDRVLRDQPTLMPLHLSRIKLLLNCEQFDAAREALLVASRYGQGAALQHLSGQLYAALVHYDEAQVALEAALAYGFDQEIAHDLARLHIIRADYVAALALLDRSLEHDRDHQLTWALISLCWRLTDDARYHWLIDYQRDVRVFTLPVPPGYASLQEFLPELRDVLLSMHTTQTAPTRQTLVGGTQTPGRLLHKQHPIIQSYKWALEQAVADYIAAMPEDSSHPLFRRKSLKFEFSGSWSVKLVAGGFHVNHVHSQGWISSACYIHLPESMNEPRGNEGCIKFGESALQLEDREVIERVIRPEAGQLALFPSYAWHGTFDIHCDETDYRLTAPFDVIPV